MSSTIASIHKFRSIAVAGIVLASLATQRAEARSATPFDAFSGAWNGGGVITMNGGNREQIRCRASYASQGDGTAMAISMACASDSYKIQVTGNVVATAGRLSGTWQEATRQVSGDVTGQVAGPGQVQAILGGTPYDITLTFNTRGKRQAIAMQIANSDVQSVAIDLQRR